MRSADGRDRMDGCPILAGTGNDADARDPGPQILPRRVTLARYDSATPSRVFLVRVQTGRRQAVTVPAGLSGDVRGSWRTLRARWTGRAHHMARATGNHPRLGEGHMAGNRILKNQRPL